MDVLVSTAECCGITRCSEEVQLFGRRRGEIDEPAELESAIEAPAYNRNTHTSGSSCHNKDTDLLGTEI